MKSSRIRVGQLTVRPHTRNRVRTGKWFVDIPAKLTGTGRRHRKLFDNCKDALEIAREVNRRLTIAGVPAIREPIRALPFDQAVLLWLESERLRVRTGKKREASLSADSYRLKSLLRFFAGTPFQAIDECRLTDYQAYRLSEGCRPATINSEIGTLKHVANWAVRRKHLFAAPTVESIPWEPRDVTIPSESEVVRLVSDATKRLRPLLVFLAETGCRKGEALNLTWDCIDREAGFADIKPKPGWSPKTGSSRRRIPLSPHLLELLDGLPRRGRYLFPGRDPNKPLGDFKKALASAVRRAGLERGGVTMRITPHVLRKANATWLASNGVHPRLLQSLLGHSPGSRMTDQHYIHAPETVLRQAAIRLPLDGPRTSTRTGKIRQQEETGA
jgi:integrase